MVVTVVSKLWATDLKNDRDLSVIFYLSCRDAILWIWLAGFVAVVKGTFAVLSIIREMEGS